MLQKRRDNYLQSQRATLLVEDARKNFFRNIKAFQSKEKPRAFDPMQLFPGKTEMQAATDLATFFNRISQEFQPLEPSDIPRTHHRELPTLLPYQVEGRIKAFCKPKSMVKGDIFPALVDKFATLLAIPLTDIYNEITKTQVWPQVWKQEFVTVIPKCRNPMNMGDLRNISCTMLPSKIYESFVLNWLGTEVTCKRNQFGGIKGCGVGHLLAEMWDTVMTHLEDARAAVNITAIDYAKAFNRLSFQHCLRVFARKGASTETIAILATFLSNRTVTVRVKNTWSDPLPVFGGVPQGPILGVLLFNVSTDDLEDDGDDRQEFVYSAVGSASSPSGSTGEVAGQEGTAPPGLSGDELVEDPLDEAAALGWSSRDGGIGFGGGRCDDGGDPWSEAAMLGRSSSDEGMGFGGGDCGGGGYPLLDSADNMLGQSSDDGRAGGTELGGGYQYGSGDQSAEDHWTGSPGDDRLDPHTREF